MVAWMRNVLLVMVGCLVMLSLSSCGTHPLGMLDPKGLIAYQERKLFFDTLALMLIVVLPVIVMSITFIYHYRASNRKADYHPDWSHSYFLESLWWGIPCVIIFILAVMTWRSSHELDPYKRITGHDEPPLLIQVVALPWKWLFIYPEQQIATVNYLQIPTNRQVEFWITADNVPMSAFFIPQLGSQIYAMAGMRTRLHLLANDPGTYRGLNTQYNGQGFSDMHFKVYAVQPEEMQEWIKQIQKSPNKLTSVAYGQLLNQSVDDKPAFYSGVEPGLFDSILNLYMESVGTEHPRANQLKLKYQVF